MTDALCSHINARVLGHDLRFRLPSGGHLVILEALLEGAIFDAARRAREGVWRVEDVRLVLAHSAVATRETGPVDLDALVARAVRQRPAVYAMLAGLVIVAGTTGVERRDATFSDEDFL